LNVLPTFATNDIPDGTFVETMLCPNCGEVEAGGVFFSEDTHKGFGQEMVWMLLPSTVGAMLVSISLVLTPGAPGQIGEAVVGGVPIREVAAFHRLGAWTDKGFKNKAVNQPCFAAWAESDDLITVGNLAGDKLVPFSRKDHASAIATAATLFTPLRPHCPVIADHVAGESLNVAVLNGTIEFGHGLLLGSKL
jgi:hypothetical protein